MKDAVLVPQQFACQADFGNDRRIELEVSTDNGTWLNVGSGIKAVDLWTKSVAGLLDLRVTMNRSPDGMELLVDRGQQQGPWWPSEDCPRLIVAVDPLVRVILVSCRVGHGAETREALLGQITLENN